MKGTWFLKRALLAVATLVLLNLLGGMFRLRWDLTEDRRFTLATPSLSAIEALDGPVVVDVLLAPLEDAEAAEDVVASLQQLGIRAASVTVEEGGSVSQELLFPWALVTYGNRTEKVPLLRNQLSALL